MFTNYLKIIARNLLKSKIYSIFSIISLSIGLLCAIIAYTYLAFELSYDNFFEHSDKIFRLEYQSSYSGGSVANHANLPGNYLPTQWASIPNIEQKTRHARLPNIFVKTKSQNRIVEKNGFAADSNFFNVFDFRIIAGTNNPLAQPNSIVLTQETAQKYFGSENPVGQTLTIIAREYKTTVTVTAVMQNVPSNSHLKFNFLLSGSAYENLFGVKLSEAYVAYQYLLLSKNANRKAVLRKLNRIREEIYVGSQNYITYYLEPITNIHLYSNASSEIKNGSNIWYVYILGIIAVIIMIISCINFVSLFLSNFIYRDKETGIRKVLGASNVQLASQILLELVMLALISYLIALILTSLMLPLFNALVGRTFTFQYIMSLGLIWKGILFSTIIGIVSGFYPLWIIFFKNKTNITGISSVISSSKRLFQNTIVTIQFSASAILIVFTLIIYSQLDYIQNKDLGFSEKNIITATNYLGKQTNLFKNILSDNENIQNISASSYIPGVSETGGTGLVKSLSNGKEITANWVSVDYNYFETYGLFVLKGRSFSKEFATDSTKAFIINQAAVKAIGLKKPVGKELVFGKNKGKIIGVVENFNYLSLHQQIPPMLFLINNDWYFSISIKLADKAIIPATLSQIKKAWFKAQPNVPFDYAFLQNSIKGLYESERNLGSSILIFSLIAILVSCMGLFSLAAYSMQKRTKEIGIRKVLGASIKNILTLFYSKYFKLILLANVIALPLAYLSSRYWLRNFAYKIDITLLPFFISFVTTSIFTVVALSYWALKAAYLNPVDSIRKE